MHAAKLLVGRIVWWRGYWEAMMVVDNLQLLVGLVMHKDRKVGQRTSGLLLCFWVLMTIYGTFKLRTYILTGLDEVRVQLRYQLAEL